MQRGLLDREKVDSFSLFVETGELSYCLYKDSERILGNTYGMCILQVSCTSYELNLLSFLGCLSVSFFTLLISFAFPFPFRISRR